MSFKNEYEDIFLNKYIKLRLYIKIYQTKFQKKKEKKRNEVNEVREENIHFGALWEEITIFIFFLL